MGGEVPISLLMGRSSALTATNWGIFVQIAHEDRKRESEGNIDLLLGKDTLEKLGT